MMTHTSNCRHSDLEHRLCTAALIYNGEDIKRYKNNMDKVLILKEPSFSLLDNSSSKLFYIFATKSSVNPGSLASQVGAGHGLTPFLK